MVTFKNLVEYSAQDAYRLTYSRSENFIGNFATKLNPFGVGIIALDAFDKEWVEKTGFILKPDEVLVRITSDVFKRHGYTPLVKLSRKTNMVYYMSDAMGRAEYIEFNTGIKMTYINVITGTALCDFFQSC